jgi:hypothetical protein
MKLPLAFLTARYTRAEVILEQSIYRMERTTVENKLRAGWKLHPAQHTLVDSGGVAMAEQAESPGKMPEMGPVSPIAV